MKEEIKVTFADEADVPEIMSIIEKAKSLVPDPEWYCADDEVFVRQHVKEEGFILKATVGDVLAGFLTVRYPKDAEDNLGVYMDFSGDEMQKVAHMETAAVRQDYTGRGIQKLLMAEGEKILHSTNYIHIMGTAHPENIYSVNNFRKLHYEVVAEDRKYGGWPRYVFYKNISC